MTNEERETLFAAVRAKRQAQGLAVEMVRPDGPAFVGYFASTKSRDDFVARARRLGRTVEIKRG